MRTHIVCGGLLILALVGWAVTGCEETTCGEGTVLREGECVPLQPANCSGPGVRFENGRCVPNYSEVCGPGTVRSEDGTQCVAVEPPLDPVADAGPDTPADIPEPDLDAQLEPDVVADVEEEEMVVWVPECDDELVAGETVCAWGQALNFVDLTPLPSDTGAYSLQVQIKDMIRAMTDPLDTLAEADIVADGRFIAPSFEVPDAPPRTLLLIVGEDEDETTQPAGPGEVWQRCISGLVQTSDTVTEHGNLITFGLPRALVTAWNTTLSPTVLEPSGFVLIRIVDVVGPGQYEPLEGATLSYLGDGSVTVRYFYDLGLTILKPSTATTTGPSGVALLIPGESTSATDMCTATKTDYMASSAVACGSNPYRASINYIYMLATD
ncbi:MAG: hypothetical protein JW797_06950 [Bradymonadales bacterium]|nr:hypothetical protein [Bradymonadales bacterium]